MGSEMCIRDRHQPLLRDRGDAERGGDVVSPDQPQVGERRRGCPDAATGGGQVMYSIKVKLEGGAGNQMVLGDNPDGLALKAES